MRDTHRVPTLLQPAGLIDNPRFHRLQVRNDLLAHHRPQRRIAPRTVADELLQPLRLHAQPLRHRLNRFTLPGISNPCT
ncbi:MAG: hypothetical protein RL077_304 [Verrucomicrobiota bacterium]|jgi:hypothetical protein